MQKWNTFWEQVACGIFPKYKRLALSTSDIEQATQEFDILLNAETISSYDKLEVLEQRRAQIVEKVIEMNRLKERDLQNEVEFDFAFLKSSIKEWDFYDYGFIIVLVGVYLLLNSVAQTQIEQGKEIHEQHSWDSGKGVSSNKVHKNMPNDKIPEGHMGLENPNGGRPGGSAKINGVSLNHRFLYGHDIAKPWEIFKGIQDIEDISPVLGSRLLGAIIKQLFHLFYDTFSKTGLPAPGSTYFT